jgi:hypothetical protein
MKFHNGTYKAVAVLLSVAIFDLLVGRIWIIASCLAIWTLTLMRNPTRVRSRCGIVSPVTGILKRILNIEINGERREHIKISTRPILDSQIFRLASNHSVSSITSDQNSITVEYTSGIIVKHMPLYQGLGGLVLEADKASLESNDEYGYSLFGCNTSVILPAGYKLWLSDGDLGRVLIDGETVIAMEEEK